MSTKPKIETSLDYSKFKTILGNREKNDHHVRELAEEIALNDLTPYFPILVNEKWEIIDGQHRYEVCKELGLPIYYVMAPGLNLKHVQRINTKSKNWNIADYVKSFIAQGREEYKTLLDFSERTGFSIPIAAALLMGMESVGDTGKKVGANNSQRLSVLIRDGKFKVVSRTNAEDLALIMKELSGYADFPLTTDRYFVFAMNKVSKITGFNFDRLLEKLQKFELRIERQVNTRQYLIEVERIYNFKAMKRMDLFTGQEA